VRVLVVDDEVDLADMLAEGLRADGIPADTAHDGARALSALAERDYDVVVLDRDLPVLHGDAVCRTLTAQGHPARILMLTAAGALGDLVDGLALGADDYLAKPFAYLELVARIRALARRGASTPSVLAHQDIRLDTQRRIAERDGRVLRLTPKEMAVLEALLEADGGTVTPRDLADRVWDGQLEPGSGAVKVTVHQLRRKLGEPAVLRTVPGFGYRL
jgi:DNA-binding response OmpR family regulator